MAGTKRTKRPSTRSSEPAGETAVLEKEPAAVVPVDADEDDDILGEIVGPATPLKATEETPDSDDAGEDILAALSDEPDVPAEDDLDDLFEDIPEAPAMGAVEDFFGPVAAPRASAPKVIDAPAPAALADDRGDPPPATDSAISEAAPAEGGKPRRKKPSIAARLPKLRGVRMPQLAGKREISRKAYVGGIGVIGLLTLVSVGQAAVLLGGPAEGGGHGHHDAAPPPAPAPLPINYAQIDLERFIDKTRALKEGGRQILHNPAVKKAIVELDSGERLYQQLETLAAGSAAADLASIRNNRVRIASCNTPACGDQTFRLVYDIGHRRAVVCVTEKYLDGAYLSYRYEASGITEVPHCG